MKQTTREILDLIEGEILKNRNEFISIAESIGIASNQIVDESFADLLTSFNSTIDIVKKAANNEILDSLSPEIRNNLKNNLNNVNNYSNELFIQKSTTDTSNFISAATTIINFIDQYSIALVLNGVPNFKQKLYEIKQLQQKLEKINEDYINVAKLLSDSKVLFDSISSNNGIYSSAKTEIEQTLQTANDIILDLDKAKNKSKEVITEIEDFYINQYKKLNEGILNNETGIEARLQYVNSNYVKINDILGKAETSLNAVQETTSEYEKVLKNLNEIHTSVQDLFNKINDPEQGVDKKYQAFTVIKTKIDELYSKSGESFKIISDLEGKIGGIHKDATDKLNEITKTKTSAETTLKNIESIYGIAADTAMGGEFHKLASAAEKDSQKWGRIIFRTTSILFIFIVFLFILPFFCNGFCNIKLEPDFLLRLTITSPVIFYLIFCTTQYKRAKDNYYKYSFKATLAFSIKNHINLLTENPRFQEKNDKNEILGFAIRGLDKLYDEPYFDKGVAHKFKIQEDQIKYGINRSMKNDSNPETPTP